MDHVSEENVARCMLEIISCQTKEIRIETARSLARYVMSGFSQKPQHIAGHPEITK